MNRKSDRQRPNQRAIHNIRVTAVIMPLAFTPLLPYLRVADDIKQVDNVDAALEVLQHFDLALNLLLLDGLLSQMQRQRQGGWL